MTTVYTCFMTTVYDLLSFHSFSRILLLVSWRLVFYLQVNGNLVSPMHVLANAEVVEIVTYNVRIFYILTCSYPQIDVISHMLLMRKVNK